MALALLAAMPTVLALLERPCEVDSVARAYVELPDGWGPQQEMAMAFHRHGYVCAKPDVVKRFGRGPDLLPIPQNDGGPHGGGPRQVI